MGTSHAQRQRRAAAEEALSRWGATHTDGWIAQRLGLSERTVANWRLRLGYWKTKQGGWYTTGQASRVTGLSPQWLSSMAREKRIQARRVLAHERAHHAWWLIAPEEVERLCRERNPELWARWRDASRW
jgi:hypothetical protein